MLFPINEELTINAVGALFLVGYWGFAGLYLFLGISDFQSAGERTIFTY